MFGKVIALHLKTGVGVVEPQTRLEATKDLGFKGDRCYGRRTRQALLIDHRHLADLGYSPGVLREQITVELDGLQQLPAGAMVQAGEVLLEIEGDCAPCSRMGISLGEDPEEFKARSAGRRGMLAMVRSNGTIKIGDSVKIVQAAARSLSSQ